MRGRVFLTVLVVIIASGFYCVWPERTYEAEQESAIKIFRSDSGWGYTIAVEKERIINQPYIPAISGYKPFRTPEQARATARLVLEKMKDGNMPVITISELDSLGIETE